MKRAVALLLTLALLGAAGMVCAHRVVGASAEAVELRETVLSGDRAAAEGVEVLMHAACEAGKCRWDTVLSIGAENTAETSFCFMPRGGGEGVGREYCGVSISVIASDCGSVGEAGSTVKKWWGPDFSRADLSRFGSPPELLLDILLDVAARTGADEKRTERLALGDYLGFLPLDVRLDLPEAPDGICALAGQGVRLSRDEAVEWLRDYFRLPVPEGLEVDVTIEKDDTGDIVYWGFSAVDVGALYMRTLGIAGEDACYFCFDVPDGDIDCSALPWGIGLYRLPLERDGGALVLRLDELEQFVPLAGGEQVREMDTFGNRVLLLTQRDGMLYLTSVNLEDMSRAETTAMCKYSRGDAVSRFILDDGSYYVKTEQQYPFAETDRRYALAEPEGDGYRLRLCGVMSEPYWGDTLGADLLWDGERLFVAKCFSSSSIPDGESEAKAYLWVYGETGLLCQLRYDSSLADPPCLVDEVEGRMTAHQVYMMTPELSLTPH